LVGQDAVVRTLRTALSSGKLAHAYLFSGPRGSGKTSAAKILARCIDCVRGPTPEPDNTCPNCLAILAGNALDVIELDAASNRGIDEIRDVIASAKFAPASMRMKVFIIDEAHMLTPQGANAFLKTLEEPPAHVVFVLATTAPEALPATILSRCQRYAFRRIPIPVMIARMREIALAEAIQIDDGALGAIAYRADGGLRDALTMLEQVASYAGGAVDTATVEAAFGASGRQYARALVDSVLAAEAARALRIVDEASDAGADMPGLMRGAISEYRNLLVARIDPELLSRDLSNEDAASALALAARTPQPKIVRGLRLLADALAAGRASGNPRLELETAVLRLIVQREDPSLEALATRVALLEAGAGAAAAPGDGIATSQSQSPSPSEESARVGSGEAAPARQNEVAPVSQNVAAPARQNEAAPPAQDVVAPESPREAAASPVARVPASAAAGASEAQRHPPVSEAGSEPVPAPATGTPNAEPLPLAAPAPPVARNGNGAPGNGPAAGSPPDAVPTLLRVKSLWKQIRLRAEEEAMPLRAPLSRATVDVLAGDLLTITVPDDFNESILRPRLAILERAIAAAVGSPLRVLLRNRTSSNGGASEPAAPAGSTPSAPATSKPASAEPPDGEIDLLAYAREKIGRTKSS
jgi:DNA polymerase-3 subunit gamma/tau